MITYTMDSSASGSVNLGAKFSIQNLWIGKEVIRPKVLRNTTGSTVSLTYKVKWQGKCLVNVLKLNSITLFFV